MKKMIKQAAAFLMALMVLAGALPMTAFAYPGEENTITVSSTPKGKIGRSMTVSFTVNNYDEEDWEDVTVGFTEEYFSTAPGALEGEGVFPFEVTESTFETKHVGRISGRKESGKPGQKKVSLTARVRSDLQPGYYHVSINVNDSYAGVVTIWVDQPSGEDDDKENMEVGFVLGENQSTPYGTYPNVMEFSINMRNSGLSEAKDVTVSMGLDKDSGVFPFEINDGNYNRTFETIGINETVQLGYSMAIREEAYSGYYPIKYTISYRETATGSLKTEEDTFWVHIKNKDDEEKMNGDLSEKDRTRARLVVDSVETVPERIIAGEPFKLILRIKNASSEISASNILLDLKAEKTSGESGSAAFSTESGSSSVAIDTLQAGGVKELTMDFLSKAGIDQRSYALTIDATYDSPEYKNATSSLSIDIPIYQVARLNTGTIEVMPEAIDVGSESNIMFPINNTGKVILYNVMVDFIADSIAPVNTYVGNIKPGETGNVDAMVSGIAPTMDEGKVKIRITYEDENGQVQEPVEKELNLFVSEPVPMEDMGDMMAGNMDEIPMEPESPIKKYGKYVAVAAVIVGAAVAAVVIKKRKKKKADEDEDLNDEIS